MYYRFWKRWSDIEVPNDLLDVSFLPYLAKSFFLIVFVAAFLFFSFFFVFFFIFLFFVSFMYRSFCVFCVIFFSRSFMLIYFYLIYSSYRLCYCVFTNVNTHTRKKKGPYGPFFLLVVVRIRVENGKFDWKRLILWTLGRSPSAPSPLLTFSSCLSLRSGRRIWPLWGHLLLIYVTKGPGYASY